MTFLPWLEIGAGLILLGGGLLVCLFRSRLPTTYHAGRVGEAVPDGGNRHDSTEAALADTQLRLHALFNNARDAILLADDDARIVDANPAACSLLAHSREAVLRMTVFDITPVPDRAHGQALWRSFVETGGDQSGEYPLLREDGKCLTVEYRAVANILPGLHLSILRDVTERKQVEDLIRKQQAELVHMARLSLAGELATGLAHELNQPLTAIVNYVNACRRLLGSGQFTQDEATELMGKVEDQSIRAAEIIHRLREFIRKREPAKESFDINALIKAVIRLVGPEAHQKGVGIRLDLHESLPSVMGDAIQIQQVILNLMHNGIEAMQDTAAGEREVDVRTLPIDEDTIEVDVADRGAGLSEQAMNNLFQPFFTTKPQGMGLGLSLSRSIIQAHGGRLWATPNETGGVTFRFTLYTQRLSGAQ